MKLILFICLDLLTSYVDSYIINNYMIILNILKTIINCTQDYSTIKAETRKAGKYKIDAEDLGRAFAAYKESSEKSVGALNIEIARLKALLQQQNVLANVELADLLRELVRRLTNIIKHK